MSEPKLLTAAELAEIRERAAKDGRFTQSGWTNKCMADRRALLAHLDAVKSLELVTWKGEMFCGHCGVPLTLEQAPKHYCAPVNKT
jgi:hypothetical protein